MRIYIRHAPGAKARSSSRRGTHAMAPCYRALSIERRADQYGTYLSIVDRTTTVLYVYNYTTVYR